MSTARFIEDIHPFIIRHGWVEGHKEYFGKQRAETGENHTSVDLSLFSSKQCVWKLLLPGDFESDLFVVDTSLGAVPLDLSKSYKRVIACSWYSGSAELIRKRVAEAGAENVHVLGRFDPVELKRLGCRIGVSLIIITHDMLTAFGEKAVMDHIASVLAAVGESSSSRWSSIFVFPQDIRSGFPMNVLKLVRRKGMSSQALCEMSAFYGLRFGATFNCRSLPESIAEIDTKNFLSPYRGNGTSPDGRRKWYGSLHKAALKLPFTYPSQVLLLSREKAHPIWMDGFLSHLKAVTGSDFQVRKYFSGNPCTLILELHDHSGFHGICRMPLGRGTINLKRVTNNYAALEKLEACRAVSGLTPKPIACGIYQGQEYFIESFLAGSKVNLTSQNHPGIYRIIRPALFSFYRDAGQDTVISEAVFQTLVGDSLEMLQRYARDNSDRIKIQELRDALKGMLHDTHVRLPLTHGDFKIENMMFGPDGLSGIIDWDLSSLPGLPFLDLLYLYGYSFHHSARTDDRGMTGFIHGLIRQRREPVLQEWYEDYSRSLCVERRWEDLSGVLFWLHYVTKTLGTALPSFNALTYKKLIQIPLDTIMERIRSQE